MPNVHLHPSLKHRQPKINTTKDHHRRISIILQLSNSTDSLRCRATHRNNILNISSILNSQLNKRHLRQELR